MRKTLLGRKTAVLVANGYSQSHLDSVQEALMNEGSAVYIIAPDSGLVRGWTGSDWAQHMAVDVKLDEALGVDYDFVVVPGGRRSLDKLKLHAHTKRFLGSFFESNRPIAVMHEALQILLFTGQICSKKVSGPICMQDEVTKAGGIWQKNDITFDGSLMTGLFEGDASEDYLLAMLDHFRLTTQTVLVA